MAFILILFGVIVAYSVVALVASVPGQQEVMVDFPKVSVLKPLCGAEPRLYENLLLFCQQDYAADYQLVFGVAAADDPAIAIVKRLQNTFPALEIVLVVDASVHGENRKVNNLMNMMPHVRYDVLVLSDSDIAVTWHYLKKVVQPLLDPLVGVVTCRYSGDPTAGFLSRLGADWINHWFEPAVRASYFLGNHHLGLGATLAFRRETLEKIGGFACVKDEVGDDFWLSEYIRLLNLKTVLSEVLVRTDVSETRFIDLWQREVRWLAVIRAANGWGFCGLPITFLFPWFVFGCLMTIFGTQFNFIAMGLSLCCLLLKIARLWRETAGVVPMLQALLRWPMRDILFLFEWIYAGFRRNAVWKGVVLPIAKH